MIGCYESKNDKFQSLIPKIYNKKVISKRDQLYYVGLPQDANKDATGTGKSSSLIRILEYEWIDNYCNAGFVMRLQKEKIEPCYFSIQPKKDQRGNESSGG